MRSIQLHPLSLLVGAAFAAISLLTMAQSPTPQAPTPTRLGGPRTGALAHPRDWIQIQEGAPYTVPIGKVFALTGMGSDALWGGGGTAMVVLDVNGVQQVNVGVGYSGTDVRSVFSLPIGFSAPAGSLLAVWNTSSPNHGRAWGYLVDV